VRVAGGMQNDGSGGPDAWSVYLATADAKATENQAQAEGAQVVVPAMDVGTLGTMEVLIDPSGAAIGAWQPGTSPASGCGARTARPAGSSSRPATTSPPWPSTSGFSGGDAHEVGDSDDFRYTTLGEGENQLAGIMDASGFLPEGVPSHWGVYFAVTDTDATIAKAVAAGATVVSPAMDTPYGRLASLTDPTGALFKLGSIT
jgi:predicted enzyme related to lactoylglutathione lyase